MIGQRMLIADRAMGSMLAGSPAAPDDLAGHEGCHEVLNATRPDIAAEIHDGYLAAGAGCSGYPACPDLAGRASGT